MDPLIHKLEKLGHKHKKLINSICGSKVGTREQEELEKATRGEEETNRYFQRVTPPFYISVDSSFEATY
jgi:hypothetical protein